MFQLLEIEKFPFFTLLSIAFESQQQVVCDYVMKSCNDHLNLNWCVSALELVCLNYVTSTTSIMVRAITISADNLATIYQNMHRDQFIHVQTLKINEDISSPSCLIALTDALRMCRSLEKLKVNLRDLKIDDVMRLADAFYHLTNLKELKLKFSLFSEGIMSLLLGLQSISGLQLKLKCSKLGLGGIQELVGLKNIFPNVYLSKLSIRNCDFTLDSAIALVEALQGHMKLLTVLHVADNNISPFGAFIMASVLPCPSALCFLDMSHLNLDDEGAANVAAGMKFMPLLKSLNLSYNCFGPEGSTALGYEMCYLTELSSFDISDNCVRSSGAHAIALGLNHCTRLKYLYMRNTKIDIHDAIHIIQGLKQCPIETADLGHGSPENHFCSNLFIVEGLISAEDEKNTAALVAAVRHDCGNRTLDLGFDSTEVKAKLSIIAEFYFLYFKFMYK